MVSWWMWASACPSSLSPTATTQSIAIRQRPLQGPGPRPRRGRPRLDLVRRAAVWQWSLTSLNERLIKIGARILTHSRYVTFQLTEVAVLKGLLAEILRLTAEAGRCSILAGVTRPVVMGTSESHVRGVPR